MPLHYSYIYSVPYLLYLLFLIYFLFKENQYINNKRSIKKIELIIVLSLLLFIGLRGFVYTDWITYYDFFQKLPTIYEWESWTLESVKINWGFEEGFILYSIILKSIFPNYFGWVFIGTIVDIIVIHSILKRNVKYYVLGIIAFYIWGGLTIEFNLYRNSKAIILFLLSIKYIKEKDICKYLFFNIIGCFFHITSLIYLPLYFILNKKINLKIIWMLFIIGNVIYLFQIPYIKNVILIVTSYIGGRLDALVNFYFSSSHHSENYGITIGYIERTFSFILWAILYRRYSNNFSTIYSNLFLIYLGIFLFFSEVSIILQRLPLLFIFSYAIIYPQIFTCFKHRLYKKIFYVVFFIYAIMKVAVANIEVFSKYDNLLFGIESYETRTKIFHQYIDSSK